MNLSKHNVWLTSDTHFGHGNLVRGSTRWDTSTPRGLAAVRDFDSLDEMNKTMVKNINDNVGAEDWLVHMGDWSFGGFENIETFRSMINCKKIILILGNHDHHIKNNKENIRRLFHQVHRLEDLYLTRDTKSDSEHLILSHYPIISWEGMRKGTFMIHGHQHLKGDARFGQGRRMDVGICGSPGFRPYHVDEVLGILKERVSKEPESGWELKKFSKPRWVIK